MNTYGYCELVALHFAAASFLRKHNTCTLHSGQDLCTRINAYGRV